MNEESFINDAIRAVVDGNEEAAVQVAKKALEVGLDPIKLITEGFAAGMQKISILFDRGEIFLPNVVIASEAMLSAVKILEEHVPIKDKEKRYTVMMILERVLARDTIELAPVDGSYKPVKPIISMEQQDLENALALTIAPVFYCAMPNPGLYYRPDGCCGNPSELLPQGKIKEACQAQEEAVEYAVRDMVFVGKKLFESGADGMNLDTVGAAGDAEFLATLKAIKEIKKQTNLAFQVGMVGEFIIGIHGGVEFEGHYYCR